MKAFVLAATIGALGTVLLGATASRSQSYDIDAVYHAHLNGVRVGTAQVGGRAGSSSYRIQISGTYGLIGLGGTFAASADGEVARGTRVIPARYRATGSGRTTRTTDIEFDAGTITRTVLDPPLSVSERSDRVPVSEQQLEGAVDPLSGFVDQILQATRDRDPCQGTVKVFSGLARFDVALGPRGSNRSDGILSCQAVYRPIAGHRRSDSSTVDRPINIFFPAGATSSDEGARLPTRIEVPLWLGQLVIERSS